MSLVRLKYFLLLALVSTAFSVKADEKPLIDNADLLERLQQQPDSGHQVGEPFASEVLDCDYYNAATVDYVISDEQRQPEVVFTSIRTTFAGYFLFPSILARDSTGTWTRTPIPRRADGWTHIHESSGGERILISMDNVPESAGWETRFVLSEDGGQTWRYGESVRKYVYFDIIRYFRMNNSGQGSAVEHYTGGIGGYDAVGYYIFETSDWGNTWSGPEFAATYDTSDYTDVLESWGSRLRNRRPLRELDILDADTCPTVQ